MPLLYYVTKMEESKGFEPLDVLPPSVFKTDVIDHSTNSPCYATHKPKPRIFQNKLLLHVHYPYASYFERVLFLFFITLAN